ncbi:protease inhibitor Epi10 [Phytophthora megakarya]|uniref:Protease inhibitor Epi10 n=1 Tax=Phytophthora megakarya TaxID=4795 RepID=A0A225URZ9_9STRA|nr:protease inhibitor Epi10 [Phytophthora megakarya]
MKLILNLALFATAVASDTDTIDDKCSFGCPDVYEPVCGSDETTYSSSCYLRLTSCQSNSNITLAFDGECSVTFTPVPGATPSPLNMTYAESSSEGCPDECADEACFVLTSNCQDQNDDLAAERNLNASDPTDCPDACLDVDDPVTDENGVEYSNECYMRLAKCQDSSDNIDRKLRAHDQADCPDACLDVDDPVTDENGEEYSNECYMKMAKCQKTNNNLDIERKLAIVLGY